MNKFIAVVAEQADQAAIMGIGATEEEAIADAVKASGADAESFVAQPCSDRLYDEVAANGTPERWTERDGLQDIDDEEEEGEYGTAEKLAAIIIEAAETFDAEEEKPGHFYVQFSKTDGWEAAFSVDNDYEMSMTCWDTSDEVSKLYDAIKAGNDDAALEYAGDILGGWESEWDDE
jgi:hypothetical protein